MPSFKQILFPVDFSPQNRAIAPQVLCMAARYRAAVTMLHVMEMPTGVYPGWPDYTDFIDLPAMIRDREQQLRSFLKSEFETVATTRLILEGAPAQIIPDYSAKEKIDLIMMPTHGYSPFRRLFLGSVTARTLRAAHCPVWTSAHVLEIPEPFAGYHTVLCAVDLTSSSLPLLRWAFEFASERHAVLKLVHAIPTASLAMSVDIDGAAFRSALFETAEQEAAQLQADARTNLQTVLEGGEVAAVVTRAAQENRADLVIIGRGVMPETLTRQKKSWVVSGSGSLPSE